MEDANEIGPTGRQIHLGDDRFNELPLARGPRKIALLGGIIHHLALARIGKSSLPIHMLPSRRKVDRIKRRKGTRGINIHAPQSVDDLTKTLEFEPIRLPG